VVYETLSRIDDACHLTTRWTGAHVDDVGCRRDAVVTAGESAGGK